MNQLAVNMLKCGQAPRPRGGDKEPVTFTDNMLVTYYK